MRGYYAFPSLSLRFVAVWRRHFLVWRKLAIPSILGNLADPLIVLSGPSHVDTLSLRCYVTL